MVGDLIAVRKTHPAPDRHDGKFRNEAAPLLPDLEYSRGDAQGTSRGPEGYHRTGQRLALFVDHSHLRSTRPSRGWRQSGCDDKGAKKQLSRKLGQGRHDT